VGGIQKISQAADMSSLKPNSIFNTMKNLVAFLAVVVLLAVLPNVGYSSPDIDQDGQITVCDVVNETASTAVEVEVFNVDHVIHYRVSEDGTNCSVLVNKAMERPPSLVIHESKIKHWHTRTNTGKGNHTGYVPKQNGPPLIAFIYS
jgi:hypothetical protein